MFQCVDFDFLALGRSGGQAPGASAGTGAGRGRLRIGGDDRMSMRYVYLHGFASGPQSRKAQFFREKLASVGVALEIPALDEGDFEHLTITRQLAFLTRLLLGEPVVLMGSSMGGYLAALYASHHP